MKTLLVPTDYSKESRNALLFAIEIARLAKSDIVLFHVFHRPVAVSNAVHVEDAIADFEREENYRLEEFAAEVKEDSCKNFSFLFTSTVGISSTETPVNGSGAVTQTKTGFHRVETGREVTDRAAVKIKCVSKLGWAADEIRTASQTHKADLIIMSMRGAGAVSQVFMGSTVAAVMQSAQVPVLALPHMTPFKGFQSVVFATDLTKLPNKAILVTLREWVQIFRADFMLLHLYHHQDQQKEQDRTLAALEIVDQELFDVNYKVFFEQRDDIAEGIQEFVQDHHADLLVLVPGHHTFLERLFRKSVTGKITAKAFMPLLTLPNTLKPIPDTETQHHAKHQA